MIFNRLKGIKNVALLLPPLVQSIKEQIANSNITEVYYSVVIAV